MADEPNHGTVNFRISFKSEEGEVVLFANFPTTSHIL